MSRQFKQYPQTIVYNAAIQKTYQMWVALDRTSCRQKFFANQFEQRGLPGSIWT